MFFELAKIGGAVAEPGNLLTVVLVVGAVLLWTRGRRLGRLLVTLAALGALVFATVPMGEGMIRALENRFPAVRELPAEVDGIVALGGVVNPWVTEARGQLSLGGGIERLTELAALGRRYPGAKLIFSGGSGDPFRQDLKEAEMVKPYLESIGLDPARVILEAEARNTHENAQFTYRLAGPKPGETWVLITSAVHMPRAAGSFRMAGWTIIPYPVDYNLLPENNFTLRFNLQGGLSSAAWGIHEWLGLLAYRLTGRTDALFPGPREP
ncbi:MAG: YdcF family protein [Rhodospirillales bacterium]|nr:YdcF family protein [Rhodospirillales bacterium]